MESYNSLLRAHSFIRLFGDKADPHLPTEQWRDSDQPFKPPEGPSHAAKTALTCQAMGSTRPLKVEAPRH